MVKMIKNIAHAGEDLTEKQQFFFEKYLASPEPGTVPDQYTEAGNRILEERIGNGPHSLEILRGVWDGAVRVIQRMCRLHG